MRPFDRALARRLIGRWAQATWVEATLALFPTTPLVLSGELPHPERPGIIVANHQVVFNQRQSRGGRMGRRAAGQGRSLEGGAGGDYLATTRKARRRGRQTSGRGRTQRPGIIVANHQVDTDWLYMWEVARAVGAHGNLKVHAQVEPTTRQPLVVVRAATPPPARVSYDRG